MKNRIQLMLVMLCSLMIAIAFVACGSDDNDNNGSNSSETTTLRSMLVDNAWYIVYEYSNTVSVDLYLFHADGTADAAELHRRSSDGYTTTHGERYSVNYSVVDNRLTIVESDGDTRVAQVDITNATTTTMRPVNSDGTLREAQTIYLLAKGKTAEQLISEGTIEDLMNRLTAARRH